MKATFETRIIRRGGKHVVRFEVYQQGLIPAKIAPAHRAELIYDTLENARAAQQELTGQSFEMLVAGFNSLVEQARQIEQVENAELLNRTA